MNKLIPFDSSFDISPSTPLTNLTFSVRAKHFCDLNKIETLGELISYYIDNNGFNPSTNVSSKTINELTDLCLSIISNGYNRIHKSNSDTSEIIRHEAKSFHEFSKICKSTFNIIPEYLIEYKDTFYQGNFQLFKFLKYLLEQGSFLNEIEFYCINHYKKNVNYIISDNKETLEDVASKFNLTKERIRQIKNRIDIKINKSLKFLSNYFEYTSYKKYFTELEDIIILENISSEINQIERTNFTDNFIIKIFCILTGRNYEYIYDNKHELVLPILIKKELFNSFNFNMLYKELKDRITISVKKDYNLKIQTLIDQFQKDDNDTLIPGIKNAIKTIVANYFADKINVNNDHLIFLRNTKKQVFEYAIDVLKRLNEPTHINLLFEEIQKQFPDLTENASSLKSTLLLHKDIFVYYGKMSTYGLKEWENVSPIGTIRNIVYNALRNSDKPIHVFELYKRIKSVSRSANPKHLIANLKLDDSNRFIFLKNDYIGLNGKKYPVEFIYNGRISRHLFTLVKTCLKNLNSKIDNEQLITFLTKKFALERIQAEYLLYKLNFNNNNEINNRNSTMANEELNLNSEEMEFNDDFKEEDEVIDDIPKEQRILRTQAYDMSISDVISRLENNEIVLDPDYQRNYVWDNKKASLLVESILLNVPIPVIYVAEDDDSKWNVVDGLQRLNSLKRFFNDEFKLNGLGVIKELEQLKYSELNPTASRILKNGILRIIKIFRESHPEIKYDIFMRLNRGAIKLTEQELRNCLYRGSLNNLLKDLITNDKFMKMLGLKAPHKRMNDAEIILRYFAISDNFDEQQNQLKNYSGKMKSFLNKYMNQNKNISDVKINELSNKFNSTIEKIFIVFGDKAFRRIYQDNTYDKKLNRAIMDFILNSFEKYEKEILLRQKDKIIDLLKNLPIVDNTFMETLTTGTSDTRKLEYRLTKWGLELKKILEA